MDRNEKKKYLHGYQNAVVHLHKLQEEYEKVLTEATKIVPELSGMPSSNVKDDRILKYTIKLTEISTKINKTQAKIAKVDDILAHLRPYHRYLINSVDIKHIPINAFAKMTKQNEDVVRQTRNRIIDKIDL